MTEKKKKLTKWDLLASFKENLKNKTFLAGLDVLAKDQLEGIRDQPHGEGLMPGPKKKKRKKKS